jgi:membrane protein implicated in regulation of membrane protease activity
MNKFKIIVALAVLLLAAVGAFFVFGLIAWAFQYLFWIGVLAVVVGVAYKVLKRPARPQLREIDGPDWELDRADRVLEDMKRKQLLK